MLRLGRVGVGFGVDHQGVRVRAVGDPELGPVQYVIVLGHRSQVSYGRKKRGSEAKI